MSHTSIHMILCFMVPDLNSHLEVGIKAGHVSVLTHLTAVISHKQNTNTFLQRIMPQHYLYITHYLKNEFRDMKVLIYLKNAHATFLGYPLFVITGYLNVVTRINKSQSQRN